MKLDKADIVFSHYIRLRDKMCMRCHSSVTFNDKGLPNSHQASHFFGRGKENTRYDSLNVDTLCMGCHRIWGSDNREEYRAFKIQQLGEEAFTLLCLRAEMYCKRDRKLAYIASKELLKTLRENTS